MNQSHFMSRLEITTSMVIGTAISAVIYRVLFPENGWSGASGLALFMFAQSWVRSYCVRRYFERLAHRGFDLWIWGIEWWHN